MDIRHALPGFLTAAFAVTGCFRVDETAIRVKDPHVVGVAATADGTSLLAANGPPETVVIHRNAASAESLSRTATGALDYISEHWALGRRTDTTPLVDSRGRLELATSPQWASSIDSSESLAESIRRSDVIRVPVTLVKETGPFGTCNGTLYEACITNPGTGISLVVAHRDIEAVDVVRTPVRSLGIVEVVLGAVLVGAGVVDGGVTLSSQPSEGRNLALGAGVGLVVLGAALVGNGLWRVLTPEQRFSYRAPTVSQAIRSECLQGAVH